MNENERLIMVLQNDINTALSEGSEFASSYVETLRDAIALLKKERWISVKDRLPEKYIDVIVFVQGTGIECYQAIAWISTDDGDWGSEQIENLNTNEFITHWMPLPEPPKEVSGDG